MQLLKSSEIKYLQENPVYFIEEIMGVKTLEPYQKDVLSQIATHKRIAISACHDVGKSFMLGRVVPWLASVFPYCKIITTAPTFNQVKNILWSEIRSAHAQSKADLGGRLNLADWQLSPDGDWFALGFAPRNELNVDGSGQGSQSTFQGFHAPYLFIIFDEATGIPPNLWTMAEGMMTSYNVKWICIGNPTSPSSQFARCFKSRAWHKIYLSCFNSPNLIANGFTDKTKLKKEIDHCKTLNDEDLQKRLDSYKVVNTYLLSTDWVVERILDWGWDHPLTVSKIFGEFPRTSTNTLVGLDQVEESFNRLYHPTAKDKRVLGVDVARFGSDSTVFTGLHGAKQIFHQKFQKQDTMVIAGEVINAVRENGFRVLVIDGTGLGGGVVDALREKQREKLEALKGVEIRDVQFGARPFAKKDSEMTSKEKAEADKYANLKARMFGLLQEAMKSEMQLFDENAYLEELPTILYSFDSKGRMVIESKDDYKKRTGRSSPDNADSLALANFGRFDASGVGKMSGLAQTEKDPEDRYKNFPKPFAASLKSERKW